jgi:TolA-binding protein
MSKLSTSSFLLSLLCVLVAGCANTGFKTVADMRDDSGEANHRRQNSGAAAKGAAHDAKPAPATTASRFEEYDEQVRALNGRVETLENALNQSQAALANAGKDKAAQDQRFQAYEEALKKLETQIANLQQAHQLMAQSDDNKEPASGMSVALKPAAGAAVGGKKSAYDEGEELFHAKKWKESIVAYQKYRDVSPKGKSYADSTYKMGVAFQELGLKDEAKAFYEEVSTKFPKSMEAKKAAYRLKNLK